jgi:trafficking protein particle complex subunit 11
MLVLFIFSGLFLSSTRLCAVNHITIDDKQSSGLIKGVNLGTLGAGEKVAKTICLTSTGGAGDRSLDLSFQSSSSSDSPPSETEQAAEATELLQSLVVPTVHPFKTEQKISYRRTSKATRGTLDLATFEGDFWDDSDGGEAVITTSISCTGPWGTKVEGFKLVRKVRTIST